MAQATPGVPRGALLDGAVTVGGPVVGLGQDGAQELDLSAEPLRGDEGASNCPGRQDWPRR